MEAFVGSGRRCFCRLAAVATTTRSDRQLSPDSAAAVFAETTCKGQLGPGFLAKKSMTTHDMWKNVL
jgi:hypothetical protein